MQLASRRSPAVVLERRVRRGDQSVTECLQLQRRRTAVLRCAMVLRMLKRVLAARAAQRMMRGARRRARFVRTTPAVDEQRARHACGVVLGDGPLYRYHDRTFQILVNGRSGKVVGKRPWSTMKIVRLVLLIAAAVGLIAFLVMHFQK